MLIRITSTELAKLPEYSLTVPTVDTVQYALGLRWKLNRNAYRVGAGDPDWWLGRFVVVPGQPDKVQGAFVQLEVYDPPFDLERDGCRRK